MTGEELSFEIRYDGERILHPHRLIRSLMSALANEEGIVRLPRGNQSTRIIL